ncbi:hypothetical protein [Microseira sp. BLCC-F43]|uniref:hypothetical protein n=1 Tax=Microseira sp. BLCC-F43 TaxID=3153602 RepID=UPI0035B73407
MRLHGENRSINPCNFSGDIYTIKSERSQPLAAFAQGIHAANRFGLILQAIAPSRTPIVFLSA